MSRVVGIDPGTVSIDLCGLEDGRVWLDRSLPTHAALQDPTAFIALLSEGGRPDLIAGPSGYGLPLIRADQATEQDLRLAFLAAEGEPGGIGGLRTLARVLGESGLPVIYPPGVIHLPSVPSHRKLNRADLGTADKVAVAALGIVEQVRRLKIGTADASFLLLELGGAFTAALAVDQGAIVDGIGGTGGPLGWQSGGGWDGEVAFLAGVVTKDMLFRGGRVGPPLEPTAVGLAAYVESAHKAVLALTASLPAPLEVLLSGRHAQDAEVRSALEPRLAAIAPVLDIKGFARVAKQGAQGAALIADGLAGGEHRILVETLRLRESSGTALDYLRVITPETARRRIGLD
jgi:predicted butyrate kinase (DUF1464 family)